jgi:hypothetical protein
MDSDAMWDIVDIDAKFYSSCRCIKRYVTTILDKKARPLIDDAVAVFENIKERISALNKSASIDRASTVLDSMNSCITEFIKLIPEVMDQTIHHFPNATNMH